MFEVEIPANARQNYFKVVVITSRKFVSEFGTYRVESSGPNVTLRGKESFETREQFVSWSAPRAANVHDR